MTFAQQLLDIIAQRADVALDGAIATDVARLDALQLPAVMREFHARHSPSECAEIADVRLLTIADVVAENRDFVPGCHLQPLGFAVFATTVFGDVFCVDLSVPDAGEPPIVLMSHELEWDEMSLNSVRRLRKVVAPSFVRWLELFAEGALDLEPLYEPPISDAT
jgi:hypothetical protein